MRLGKMIRKRAQSTAEYAILLAVVVGAIVAMQIYVRRGLQGRIASVVDQGYTIAGADSAQINLSGRQFEPYYLQSGEIKQEITGRRTITGDTEGELTYGDEAYTTTATGARESVHGINLEGKYNE